MSVKVLDTKRVDVSNEKTKDTMYLSWTPVRHKTIVRCDRKIPTKKFQVANIMTNNAV